MAPDRTHLTGEGSGAVGRLGEGRRAGRGEEFGFTGDWRRSGHLGKTLTKGLKVEHRHEGIKSLPNQIFFGLLQRLSVILRNTSPFGKDNLSAPAQDVYMLLGSGAVYMTKHI